MDFDQFIQRWSASAAEERANAVIATKKLEMLRNESCL
jgi:hypothetical protein